MKRVLIPILIVALFMAPMALAAGKPQHDGEPTDPDGEPTDPDSSNPIDFDGEPTDPDSADSVIQLLTWAQALLFFVPFSVALNGT